MQFVNREITFYRSFVLPKHLQMLIKMTQLAIVFFYPLQLKLCSDESYKREQEMNMFL